MALALTRKHGESIVLSKDGETLARITIMECGSGSNKVKLGFEAPRDVSIMREEILDRKPKK